MTRRHPLDQYGDIPGVDAAGNVDLIQAAAAVFLRERASGKAKPNFGRSFPLRVLLGSEQEVARVEHESPRDFCVQLGDTNSMFDITSPNMPFVTLLYGNGGVGNVTQRLDVPVRGSVYHVVASTLVVRAKLIQDEGATPDENARFSANIGYGRPSYGQTTQELSIGTGAFADVRLLPWVTSLRVVARALTAGPFVDPSFDYINITSGGTGSVGTFTNPIETALDTGGAGVAFPQGFEIPIPYVYANGIRITNNDPGFFCEVRVTQYWQV